MLLTDVYKTELHKFHYPSLLEISAEVNNEISVSSSGTQIVMSNHINVNKMIHCPTLKVLGRRLDSIYIYSLKC